MSMISGIIWIAIVIAIVIAVLVSVYGKGQKQGKMQNNTAKSSVYVSKPQQTAKKPSAYAKPKSVKTDSSAYEQRPAASAVSATVSTANNPAQQRQRNKKGERIPAMRLYEGDPIPKGYRMVKCTYCGAENLISYSERQPHMCYFCHEDL